MNSRDVSLFMEVAAAYAKRSHAQRLKVGAVIVRDRRILSAGYNGTPPGMANECEIDGATSPLVIHAEANAIYRLARDGDSASGAHLFCTCAPCLECAKMILSVGIKGVWFNHHYRCNNGIDLLQSQGVEVRKVEKG